MSKTGSLVLGLGARAGVPGEELNAAVDVALRQAGLDPDAIVALATLDRRAAEAGVRAAAQRHSWPVIGFTAADLAAIDVPHASERVAAATGTPSVAEAAALLAAGPDAVLVLPKTAFPRATVAIAQGSLERGLATRGGVRCRSCGQPSALCCGACATSRAVFCRTSRTPLVSRCRT